MKHFKTKKVTHLYRRLIKINAEISALSDLFDEKVTTFLIGLLDCQKKKQLKYYF